MKSLKSSSLDNCTARAILSDLLFASIASAARSDAALFLLVEQ